MLAYAQKPVQQDDDWSAIFRPPQNESIAEKQARIARQQEAARRSKEIDGVIEKSKKQLERRKKAIKVLLLGQAESGKSTMLRNFQLAFCPNYFHREIPIWKIIVQLNLIGSVKRLLAIIEEELDSDSRHASPPGPSRVASPVAGPSSRPVPSSLDIATDPPLTQAHFALRLRLIPLLSAETNLSRQLLPEFGGDSPPLPSSTGWSKWASGAGVHPFIQGNGEICVRAGGAWKNILERVTGTPRNPPEDPPTDNPLSRHIVPRSASPRHTARNNTRPHPSDPTPLLEALAPDIHSLWTDPAVRALLKRRGVQMEHSAGFFLNDVLRIGKPGWKPAIDDIVRARLRTFGVEEHRFSVDNGSEWYIYDVGGSRGSRHQWISYFDDVQAIIFLAPLVFNQMLDEDKQINRLEDSICLWKEVCSSPLLARANIILFLNKMDILKSTLKSGVRVDAYVPTYAQPNDVHHVVKYFRDKFRSYHKRLSPKQRTFYCHETSAIDTEATQAVLRGVREGIVRANLEKLSVI